MRKDVPKLNDQVTKEDFLDMIVESFQTVIFATVDDAGHPRSNAADIELRENNKLIFSTIKDGNFHLKPIKKYTKN
ncbi:hypothetical protein GCM10022297_02690 [Lactobacillus hamsteri]|uniref:Pyridoxamine 5'-phosphate oxidase putative domain-containing protein n=1 Tax=Lactobacillus hamsteri DSM 5661 = JCM 6256 TaxID=1423754 RepID=A0A0R1YE20_9LACO|nr:hypothetical protein [Lactobacillus hamsteri]KRM40261.1 hypothetical protein FC39_GL000733 [Lactobacillus hamsteri DSM 5661 = JCM 6256]